MEWADGTMKFEGSSRSHSWNHTSDNKKIPPSLQITMVREERKFCIINSTLFGAEWHQTNIAFENGFERKEKKSLKECDLNNSISESFLLIEAP